jgi:hypothetical protein
MKSLRQFWFAIPLAFFWCALFISGLRGYEGSKLLYAVFSLVSTGLMISGLFRSISYSYLFLSLFLWLGLWFKLTANYLLFGFFPFSEPVGNFDGGSQAWDLVLTVATIACAGALAGRWICGMYWREKCTQWSWGQGPKWYPSVRKFAWCSVVAAVLMTAIINMMFGIHQVGISPHTIFIWPANALIAWFLNIGAALLISVLICWDFGLYGRIGLQVYAILGEAFFSTISIFSRGLYLFHTIPPLIPLSSQRSIREEFFARHKIFIYATIFISLFITSIASVSILRDKFYIESKASLSGAYNADIKKPSEVVVLKAKEVQSFRLYLAYQLLIGRWIGIEGLMSITSYEGNDIPLLLDMLKEKRAIGVVTAYQIVSKSGYQAADPKFQFASMPGIVGFLYYAGSLWLVFLAMTLLVVLMVASEHVILMLTLNPIFCSIYGMMLANFIAQFGVTPGQDLPQFAMVYLMAIILWLLCLRNRNSQSILHD